MIDDSAARLHDQKLKRIDMNGWQDVSRQTRLATHPNGFCVLTALVPGIKTWLLIADLLSLYHFYSSECQPCEPITRHST